MSEKTIKCWLGSVEVSDSTGAIMLRAHSDEGKTCYVLLNAGEARKVAATLQAFAEIKSP